MPKSACVSAILLVAAVFAFSCGDSQLASTAIPVVDVAPADRGKPPIEQSIALIEHRGKFYRMEDLTDPAFVAQSDDPFVKNFAENRNVAIQWAGSYAPTELSDAALGYVP